MFETPHIHRRAMLAALVTSAAARLVLPPNPASAQDAPLPSWNEGAAKQAIVDFVRATTERSGSNYVPPEERIAAFDFFFSSRRRHTRYTQVIYCLDRV